MRHRVSTTMEQQPCGKVRQPQVHSGTQVIFSVFSTNNRLTEDNFDVVVEVEGKETYVENLPETDTSKVLEKSHCPERGNDL